MSVPRRHLLVICAVLAALVGGVVVWFVVARDDEDGSGRLTRALAMAPEPTARIGWTDWSAVRDELAADLSADSAPDDVQAFLDDGFSADLTSTSALVESTPVLQEQYGISPATLDWELFAQSEEGAIVLMGLPDSLDLDDLADQLEAIGYREPTQDDGVWLGGADLLIQLGTLSQELAHLTLDREHRVLAASDQTQTVEAWRDQQRDDKADSIAAAAAEVEGSLSASIYDGDLACVTLAMSQASDPDRIRGAELLEQAGEVSPLRAFAIATLPSGDVRVAMGFESEEQARTNADTRAVLAAGPAPGQGGAFPDRFELGDVTAEGEVVTMDLEPLPDSYVMSDLANGPVLFATC